MTVTRSNLISLFESASFDEVVQLLVENANPVADPWVPKFESRFRICDFVFGGDAFRVSSTLSTPDLIHVEQVAISAAAEELGVPLLVSRDELVAYGRWLDEECHRDESPDVDDDGRRPMEFSTTASRLEQELSRTVRLHKDATQRVIRLGPGTS